MPKNTNNNRPSNKLNYTQKRLWISLVSLLDKKSINNISIQQICEGAMVHRTTFYNHFYDIYDLIEYGLNEIIEDFIPRNRECE